MASEGKTAVKKELYKTELCRHYAIGKRCPYRTKCQFAHGSDEIVDIARHPKYKTEPCKSYHSKGFCTYGPRCHFIHDYADDSSRNSFTRSCMIPTGIQDDTQGDDRKANQRKSNRRSDLTAATEVVTRRRVSSSPADEEEELEVFRGVSEEELGHRCQGTRKTWRQKKKEQDSEERSSDVQRQNPDYLSRKSSEQSVDDCSVDDCWVKDENEDLIKKSHPFPFFSVKESVDDKFESSSFYRNSFYCFDFPETRQTETPTAARPNESTNLQTMAKYPNAIIASNESHSESPDLFNFQTSHQYVTPNFGRKLWTQQHRQPENTVIDLNDGGDQNVKDFCSTLPAVTVNVFRRCPCSFQSSSVSRELVCDKREIEREVLSTDLRRIFDDLSKEQMFALQSSLLMDTLNQNLQQSTYG